DNLGHVDTGVQHVYGNGDPRQVIFLELGDKAVAIAAVPDSFRTRRDDGGEADVLRIHLLEDLAHPFGVGLGHRKDNRLSGELAGPVLGAGLHALFPLFAQRVLIADDDLDVGTAVVNRIRVDALLDQGVAFVLAEVNALNSAALKTRLRLVKAEI